MGNASSQTVVSAAQNRSKAKTPFYFLKYGANRRISSPVLRGA